MITVFGSGTTLDDLRKITPVEPPNAGKRWKPIPHAELVDTILDECHTRGWKVGGMQFATGREGADMAGAIGLTIRSKALTMPTGTTLSLGFLHSNARRHALKVTVGAQVTCCLNGMCTGTILLNRVHDHTVELIDEIEEALDGYAVGAADINSIVARLKETEIPIPLASDILMRAGRTGLIGCAAIGRVYQEYHHPTFKEHGFGTSWALLNAFTFAARSNISPLRQMEVYNSFREMLPVVAA